MLILCFDLFYHHHPTLGVDDVDRHGDLGTLVATTKRLKAPGMSSPRYHLDMMMIVMMIMVVAIMIMLSSPRYHLVSWR